MPRFMGTGKVRRTKTGRLNNKFKSNKELRVRFDIYKTTTTILYSLNYFKKTFKLSCFQVGIVKLPII